MTADFPLHLIPLLPLHRRRDRAAHRPPARQERRHARRAAAPSAASFLVTLSRRVLTLHARSAAGRRRWSARFFDRAVDQGRRPEHRRRPGARSPVGASCASSSRASASSSTSTRRRTWSTTSATRASSRYLNLFTGSMLILVLGDSLPVTFVGWEGVGLCSYLLIGFWFDKDANALAGRKAFVVNRIGDFGFLLAMFLSSARPARSSTRSCRSTSTELHAATLVRACRRPTSSACSCCSAPPASRRRFRSTSGCPTRWPARRRSPRSSTPRRWSPPASTWSRACTSSSRSAPVTLAVVACIGAATALFAATIGIAQRDLKKVLAYSTISQLGFMFVGVGSYLGGTQSSNYQAGIFHLVTHAFFKAGLFLGAGSVMHAPRRRGRHHDDGRPQEVAAAHALDLPHLLPRHRRHLPVRRLLVEGRDPRRAASTRAGRPRARRRTASSMRLHRRRHGEFFVNLGHWLYPVMLLAAGCTAFYMFRLYFLVFEGEYRGGGSGASSRRTATKTSTRTRRRARTVTATTITATARAHESPPAMTVVLWILAAGSVAASASSASPTSSGRGHDLFGEWLSPVLPPLAHEEHARRVPHVRAGIALGVVAARHRPRLAALRRRRLDARCKQLRRRLPAPLQARLQQVLHRRDLRLPRRPPGALHRVRLVEGVRHLLHRPALRQRRRLRRLAASAS